MKILDRYILKLFIKSWIIGILGSVVIFFSKDLFDIVHGMIIGEYNFANAIYLLAYSLSTILSFEMMHLSAIIGSLIAMSTLNSNFELTALRVSGIKFRRIVMAPLILSAMVSISLFFFTEYVGVRGNKISYAIRYPKSKEGYLRVKRNVSFRSSDGYFIKIGKVDGSINFVHNIQIIYPNNDFSGVEKVISAKNGSYYPEESRWLFNEVQIFESEKNINTFHEELSIPLRENIQIFLKDLYENEEDQKRLSIPEIKEQLEFLQSSGKNYTLLLAHLFHRRIAYPFSVFVMVMVGLALMAGVAFQGRGTAIVLGVIIGFLYYVVVEISIAFALGKIWPMIFSALAPNLLFLAIGIYLFRRAEK